MGEAVLQQLLRLLVLLLGVQGLDVLGVDGAGLGQVKGGGGQGREVGEGGLAELGAAELGVGVLAADLVEEGAVGGVQSEPTRRGRGREESGHGDEEEELGVVVHGGGHDRWSECKYG